MNAQSSAFDERGRSFEEGYFRTKEAETVEKLRKIFETKKDKEELRKATGITNEQVLDRMIELNVRGEMLTAFKLFPLVEIAWADGTVDRAEADQVIEAAVKHGVPRESATIQHVREWLKRGPTPDGRAVWKMYAAELRKSLNKKELDSFRENLLKNAHKVAEASGGILSVFFPESAAEKKIIEEIKKDLTPT